MLAVEASPGLAVFVVWVPILKADGQPDIETQALVADPRAQHFWDAAGTLSALFHTILPLPREVRAWDLYVLYARGATWSAAPPLPAYWQHQLGESVELQAPKLDAPAMLAAVRQLLP